ncbi:PREDICTED: orphan sodium- and chloride-dependent neurotransmitter transporter NTT5-like, partial [Galeopterus variegatus]|uniref:Orphan sodium- and chloride-dependent neurotransmitter transporter NTT5-like n=1 Tax=Galeopterus variegatus TaxID=482537 RepID=A0ABM0QGS2_GALVR
GDKIPPIKLKNTSYCKYKICPLGEIPGVTHPKHSRLASCHSRCPCYSAACISGNSLSSLVLSFSGLQISRGTSLFFTTLLFLYFPFRSVSTLVMLIAKGVLPQHAKPPKNILFKPPLDYLDWINKLPQHLHHQVIHSSPSCSIKVQKEKFMEGPGLAYAAFSQAVSLFPRASFWAIVFFLALLITQLGTLIRILEGIVLPLQNNIPIFIKHPRLVPVVICLGGLLGSLIFTSHPGSYIMSLFDDHVVPLTLIIVVTFQNVALAWIYGARRFREEMFSELGRLLWSPFTFLLCYVTVPGLLALLTICLMQLYQRVTPYYIAWNSNASQEVKQPYLTSTLAWVTFLSIFTLLPIPAHPLLHWWYCQNPVTSDTFKKVSAVPAKPLEWPKHLLRKSNVSSQDKFSETSSWKISLPWKRGSQSFSRFSLPLIASWFSMSSSSPGPSRQVSPVSTDLANHNRETMEEKLPNKSVL